MISHIISNLTLPKICFEQFEFRLKIVIIKSGIRHNFKMLNNL